jgi:two-component system sensor histidine kinase CpxA
MRSLFLRIFGLFFLSHLLTIILVLILLPAPQPRQPGQPRQPRQFRHGDRDVMRRRFEIVRLVSIFVVCGGIAYGLTYYLTNPTLKLRRATQRFAAGELSTRVASELGGRTDELGQLGRDFDVMAERIQNLLVSERRLLGDISHELRSPLARVQLAVDLANASADEETRGYLARIELETGRLNHMIGQLLTLTRLEAGAPTPSESAKTPVDLTDLVTEVCADADFEAQGMGRTVDVVHCEPATVLGSSQLLRSAVENVVRNALMHAPESSVVEVSLAREGANAIIAVRDHGPGVPEECLEELFRPFFRVAEARDRRSGGVGLGLSITERAVRLHGGTVRALNAEGGGLLVEMRLPLE